MKIYILIFISVSILFMQGCSQRKAIKLIEEPPREKPKKKKILKIKNLDELNEKVNIFLNKIYANDIKEPLVKNIHYDLEYVNVSSKTHVFVKFKNSFMFCGSGGCSAKMLEYNGEIFEEIESFSLIKSSIYLLHEKTPNGFSKVIVPVSYIDGTNWSRYYNVYEPFTQNETQSIYPKDIGYKELNSVVNSRKKSIKLFGKEK